jgi:hypothetical protein
MYYRIMYKYMFYYILYRINERIYRLYDIVDIIDSDIFITIDNIQTSRRIDIC